MDVLTQIRVNQGRRLFGYFGEQSVKSACKQIVYALSKFGHISPAVEVSASVARLKLPIAHALQEAAIGRKWATTWDCACCIGPGAIVIERKAAESSDAIWKAVFLK